MVSTLQGTVLYKPSLEKIQASELSRYKSWLLDKYGLDFKSHQALWEWSTNEISDFWKSIWNYANIIHSQSYEEIVSQDKMPYVRWFKGAHLNYVEQVFKNIDNPEPAIIFKSENKATVQISWKQLYVEVASLAQYFRDLGIKKSDRIAAYLPNTPQAVISFLACASVGAVWAIASPDFGVGSVLDRFKQIKPKMLIALDGYQYNGTHFDKMDVVNQLLDEIPSLEQCVIVNNCGDKKALNHPKMAHWEDVLSKNTASTLVYEQVEFNHPLWILYSSGTTGLPKPIVHSHGGIIIEQIKSIQIEAGVGKGDRLFWFTTTGWMMWNLLMGGLIVGGTIVLYDGSPSYPNLSAIWAYAEEVGITVFGTSAAYIDMCMKYNFKPSEYFKFSHLRSILSTASPLSANAFKWVYEYVKKDITLVSTSGGTDVCTAFIGGNSDLPVRAGIIPTRSLGVKVESFNEQGESVIGEVGELVVTAPMPSMPIYFWGDLDSSRYLDSYFDTYPYIWKHGDWIQINDDGSCVVYGRSDATINRLGVRMGTSEIYKIVEALPEVMDSLVIDLEYKDRPSHMSLFVVLKESESLSDELIAKINDGIKEQLSPRFVPNEIRIIQEVPKTLNGKKLEVPIRRLLLGESIERAINKDAMSNPASLNYFIDLSKLIRQNL